MIQVSLYARVTTMPYRNALGAAMEPVKLAILRTVNQNENLRLIAADSGICCIA
jgi:hypothetical protein